MRHKGNSSGVKWNKGGKKKRMKLEIGGFEELALRLDELGGDVQGVVADALEQAGETIGDDTFEAVNDDNNYPAKAIYSQGDTKKSVVRTPKPVKNGLIEEINVGFDKKMQGHGGFLITGTPRMNPIAALETIYNRKKYMKQINKDISDLISEAIVEKMEGK